MTKNPRPTKPSNLISFFIETLVIAAVPTAHLTPRESGSPPRESHRNVEYEVEVGHNSEARSGIKKKSYGGTARVAHKGDPTKLGYLTF